MWLRGEEFLFIMIVLLAKKYTEHGPITIQQLGVLLHYIVLVVLWLFREARCVENVYRYKTPQ